MEGWFTEMAGSRRKFSPEFKAEAVREVVEKSRTVAEVARSVGIGAQNLGNWVRAYESSHDVDGQELTVSERARIKELERRVRELEEENEFLGKASAFFAARRR